MKQQEALPKFASEAEEADWWYAHRDSVSAEIEQAAAQGCFYVGTSMKLALAAQMGLELSVSDVHRAQDIARSRGITYEQYLNLIVHEALDRDAAA